MLSVNSEIIPNNNSFSLPNMRLVIHIKDKKHLTITDLLKYIIIISNGGTHKYSQKNNYFGTHILVNIPSRNIGTHNT